MCLQLSRIILLTYISGKCSSQTAFPGGGFYLGFQLSLVNVLSFTTKQKHKKWNHPFHEAGAILRTGDTTGPSQSLAVGEHIPLGCNQRGEEEEIHSSRKV